MQSVNETFSVTYDAEPESVAIARAEASTFAVRVGGSPALVDSVKLAVSEAVTNAVLHAYRGRSGKVHVTAALAGTELWVLVADDGDGLQPEPDRPGLGLGLGLISQVCDEMSIVARSGGGTEVRTRFQLTAEHDRAARAAAPITSGQIPLPIRHTAVGAVRARQSED